MKIKMPTRMEFRDFVSGKNLPFSIERTNILHQQCSAGATGEDEREDVATFWRRFLKIVEKLQDECNDT